MTREEVRARIQEIGIIPAVRVSSSDDAMFAAETVAESGIPIVEVTMTVPGALKVISVLARQNHGALIVGAGTIFDVETAQQCLDAGVGFLTTPGPNAEIAGFAAQHDTVVFPGAMTPGEITSMWKAGADFVKIFPCAQLGGPNFILAMKAPFHHVPLIASGGVTQDNVVEYIRAGATAVGIGRHLIHPDAIKRREDGWIRELSRRYLSLVKEARGIAGR
jgi:2-dehydro-3-deoxyphosphogluconate aldolase/(4S)-4-hydroxy-2-oxoglutarate aldolase